ncbi:copper transpport protein [Leucoagaricus gongylophorus]
MNHDHNMHMFEHGNHGGHDMPGMPMHECTLDMLWNTNIIDTCIVFRSWHITSNTAFLFSFFLVIALGVFYEYLRIFSHRFDQNLVSLREKSPIRLPSTRSSPERNDRNIVSSSQWSKVSSPGIPVPLIPRLIRAALYGATVFLSFFLMLIFMTYNAYLILAVILGATIGHFVFGSTIDISTSAGKSMACH